MPWLDTQLSRPTRKPKSAWLAWSAVLVALVCCGLAVSIVLLTGSRAMQILAFVVGIACWLVVAGAMVLYFLRNLSGAYRNLPERPLRDQVW